MGRSAKPFNRVQLPASPPKPPVLPKVYNLKTATQDEMDKAVYIGRPSKWGNPFTIGKDGTREEVIKKFEAYLKTKPRLTAEIGELKGKNLLCWCSPEACHGDILLKLANGK